MPPPRFVQLKPGDDARPREIEHDPLLKPKVRLRAQSCAFRAEESVDKVTAYTGRSPSSILRDLRDRWEGRPFEGLPTGDPPRVTAEARTFLEERREARLERRAARRGRRRALRVRGQGDAGGHLPAPRRDGLTL